MHRWLSGLVLLSLLASTAGAREPVDELLIVYDRADAMRTRLAASIKPLLTRPPDDGPIVLPGHQGSAVAVETPRGPRLLTAVSLLAGGAKAWLVLGERSIPLRLTQSDNQVAVLAAAPWPEEVVPLRLADEPSEGVGALILSNIWSPGGLVLTRADLVERATDAVLGEAWVTTARVPDGTPLLTADRELLAVPFARWGPETTLAVGAGALRRLLALRERPVEPEAPAERRPAQSRPQETR